MARKPAKDIAAVIREGSAIDRALLQAAWEAVQLHKRHGRRMVIWRDGRIVHVRPEELERTLRRARRIG